MCGARHAPVCSVPRWTLPVCSAGHSPQGAAPFCGSSQSAASALRAAQITRQCAACSTNHAPVCSTGHAPLCGRAAAVARCSVQRLVQCAAWVKRSAHRTEHPPPPPPANLPSEMDGNPLRRPKRLLSFRLEAVDGGPTISSALLVRGKTICAVLFTTLRTIRAVLQPSLNEETLLEDSCVPLLPTFRACACPPLS